MISLLSGPYPKPSLVSRDHEICINKIVTLAYYNNLNFTAFQNFTYTPITKADGYGAIKFSWSRTGSAAEDTYIDYVVCRPDLYHGDYPEDLVYFTRSTALVLSGFQEGVGYTCTLSTMDTAGNLHDESIHIDLKSFGEILSRSVWL